MFRMSQSFVLFGAVLVLFASSGCRGADESSSGAAASSSASASPATARPSKTTARPSTSSTARPTHHSRSPTARPSAPRTASTARPAPRSHPPTARPKLAGPGTTCGTLTTPARIAARMVIGHDHASCADAVRTVKRYYRGVRNGHGGGNAAVLKVGRFHCASATAAKAQTGALGSCNTADQRIIIKIKAQHDVG